MQRTRWGSLCLKRDQEEDEGAGRKERLACKWVEREGIRVEKAAGKERGVSSVATKKGGPPQDVRTRERN